jgi:hypothetical protein
MTTFVKRMEDAAVAAAFAEEGDAGTARRLLAEGAAAGPRTALRSRPILALVAFAGEAPRRARRR